MRYINTKTGGLVETDCVVKGGDWEPYKEETKKAGKKKGKKAEAEPETESEAEPEVEPETEPEEGTEMTMSDFATIEDVTTLWRALTPAETTRAKALLPIISDSLRTEAKKVGRDLDTMVAADTALANVAKSVEVDIVARTLMTSTDAEPMTQMSESALGYSVSGTYLVPGGGLFIKKTELARLGLRRQRYGVIDLYDND